MRCASSASLFPHLHRSLGESCAYVRSNSQRSTKYLNLKLYKTHLEAPMMIRFPPHPTNIQRTETQYHQLPTRLHDHEHLHYYQLANLHLQPCLHSLHLRSLHLRSLSHPPPPSFPNCKPQTLGPLQEGYLSLCRDSRGAIGASRQKSP